MGLCDVFASHPHHSQIFPITDDLKRKNAMLPIDRLPKEEQLLVNSMAGFLKTYDTTNIGLVFEVLMFSGFNRNAVERLSDHAIAIENDRRLLEANEKRLHALPEQFSKSEATSHAMDGLFGAAAVAACTVLAFGIHFVTPLIWAAFV
jgi:hypothetical protein